MKRALWTFILMGMTSTFLFGYGLLGDRKTQKSKVK